MLTAALIAFAVLLVAWIAAPAKRDRRSSPTRDRSAEPPITWEPDIDGPEALAKAA